MSSSLKTEDFKEARKKIKYHIDELEIKIKNSKSYWHNCEYNFDKKFVLTFIDCHYNQIIHHLAEIKHHLEEINFHKKELDDVDHHFIKKIEEKVPVQRSPEDKQRFKNLRTTRCTSSKYIHQWEKMMGYENPLNEIKRRPKKGETLISEDVSKTMVKSRVKQFERTKRASSTIEAFLDFCMDKPSRGVSCPGLDDILEFPENDKTKSCNFEEIGDNLHVCRINSEPVKVLDDKFEDKAQKEKTSNHPNKLEETCSEDLLDVFESCLDIPVKEDKESLLKEDQGMKKKFEENIVEFIKIPNSVEEKKVSSNLNEDKSGDTQHMKKESLNLCRRKVLPKPIIACKKQKTKIEESKKCEKESSKKDIIEDKSIVTESKLELLDDVDALIEDDHLKIIKDVKRGSIKKNDHSLEKNKKKIALSKEETSDSDEGKGSKKSSTKPRIIELHIKKELVPDLFF